MAPRGALLLALLLCAAGARAAWTQRECEDGIANVATEARRCRELEESAGRDLSGAYVDAEPECPQLLQDEIDAIFTSCDSAEDWADAGMAATVKTLAEACGCGGAPPAAAAPALALALGLAAALLA